MRPLIVGRDPGTDWEPHHIPLTRGSSARRLASFCGLDDPIELADHFELVNLYREPVTHWDRADAERRADNMRRLFTQGRKVVLLGNDVRTAFGMGGFRVEPLTWYASGTLVCHVPHPSGRTRYWNDPAHVAKATDLFTQLIKESNA